MYCNIYLIDITEIMDLAGAELLTRERRARMERYLRREDQARCLAAGLLLRAVLGADNAGRILVSPFGKPYLPDGPCFNLSHSGSMAVLLVSDNEAGVDVEQIVPYSPDVARKVFTPKEQEWLWDQRGDSAFYMLWTGKESIMKALGLGLQLPPESFEIRLKENEPSIALGKPWFLKWREIHGHMLCSASCADTIKTELVRLSRNELLQ